MNSINDDQNESNFEATIRKIAKFELIVIVSNSKNKNFKNFLKKYIDAYVKMFR